MNPDTRHLVDVSEMDKKELNRLMGRNYGEVPEELNKQATKELGGKKEVIATNDLREKFQGIKSQLREVNSQKFKSQNTSKRIKTRRSRHR